MSAEGVVDADAIAANLGALTRRIEAARARSPRASDRVVLVAVSKRHPIEAIEAAAAAGHRDIGENYALEMVAKQAAFQGPELRWHFIGQLQRNKVGKVLGASLIHTVDSERLLAAIAKRASGKGICQDILVAVSLAGEKQKSGVSRENLGALLEQAADLEGVRCLGLMTMPPLAREPESNRALFAELRQLRDAHGNERQSLPELSMGTTSDYEVAIEEGATLVRIGTAIFGKREPNPA